MENICKFNPYTSSDLICQSFVLETEAAQTQLQSASRSAVNLVMAGRGVFVCNGIRYALTPGMLFFVREGEQFSVCSEEALQYGYISFYGRREEEFCQRLQLNGANRVCAGCDSLIGLWQTALKNVRQDNIDLVSQAVLLYSLGVLPTCRQERPDVIGQVVAMTQQRFKSPELSLPELAHELGYDAKYLSTLFKKRQKVGYNQYLQQLRIAHSAFLMEEGVTSVKNAALLSGFRDVLYFSKVFKKLRGVSPTEYLNRLHK